MSKKRDKEYLDRLNAVYDTMFQDIEAMSDVEVRQVLEDAGIDREDSRRTFSDRIRQIAYRAGSTRRDGVPPYLSRALEQHRDPRNLPNDRRRALAVAGSYLAELMSRATGPAPLQIVGAYRGEDKLSDRDKETVDTLDAELLQRARKKDAESEEKD